MRKRKRSYYNTRVTKTCAEQMVLFKKRNNLTNAEFAELAGVNQNTIWRYTRALTEDVGAKNENYLRKIAKAMDLTYSELMKGKKSKADVRAEKREKKDPANHSPRFTQTVKEVKTISTNQATLKTKVDVKEKPTEVNGVNGPRKLTAVQKQLLNIAMQNGMSSADARKAMGLPVPCTHCNGTGWL